MLLRRQFISSSCAALATSLTSAPAFAQADETAIHYRHIVFFSFKDDVTEAKRDYLIPGVKYQGTLPFVKSFFMGKNSLPKLDITPYDWLVIMDFANANDRKSYLNLDAHNNFFHQEFLPSDANTVSLGADQQFPYAISDLTGIKYRQIGLFNFKDGVNEAERSRVLASIKAQEKLPMVKRITTGRNILEKNSDAPYEWSFMTEFASEDDYKAFRASPGHKEAEMNVFTPVRSDLAVIAVKL